MKKSKSIVKVEDGALVESISVKDVPNMLDMVTKQIEEIRKNMPERVKTDVALSGFGKIEEIKDVETLLKAASTVTSKEKAYNEAAKAIMPVGLKIPTFTLHGISSEAWLADIRYRISVVANQEKLDKLLKVQKTLEANLSAKAKLAKDLLEIKAILEDEA